MLDKKNVILLLVSAAFFTDMMVYSLVIPVLPSYSMTLGADKVMIGIIFGAFSLALLVFSIPFGILSDRTGRKRFMVMGMLSLALTNVIFAFSANIYILILARLLQGMSGAATWSAGLALLADTFGPSERGEKLGIAMAVMSAGMLFGPVVGGLLYDHLGYTFTFIIPSLIACAIGLLFLVNKIPSYCIVSEKSSLAPILRTPYTFLACAAAVVVAAATFGLVEPYMPVYLLESFKATPTEIGLIFGAMSMMSVAAQPVIGRWYSTGNGKTLVALGLAASAAVITVSMFMPSLLLTGLIFAMLGITIGFAITPMMPMLSDLYGGDAESNSQGLVYGIYNTLFSLGLAIGPFVGGVLVSSLSLPLTMFGQALLLLAISVCSYLLIKVPAQAR
jgi:MFS family permease